MGQRNSLGIGSTEREIYKIDPADGKLAKIKLTKEDPEPHGLDLYKVVMWYCDAASGWVAGWSRKGA